MRKIKAFNFIPELIGDINKVRVLSENPIQFYIETGLETIRMASNIYELINTRKTNDMVQDEIENLKEAYEKLAEQKKKNQLEELLVNLEQEYTILKNSIGFASVRNKDVRSFIGRFRDNLLKVISCLEKVQKDPTIIDFPEYDELMECCRKAFRDYMRMIELYEQGEQNDGEIEEC